MSRSRPRGLAAVMLAAICLPAVAQQPDDDQTQDYEQQDRLYEQRHLQQQRARERKEALEADPQATIDAFLVQADRLIRRDVRHYRAANGEHCRVQLDDPRLDPQPVAQLVDAFHAYFEAFWSGRAELADYESVSRIFLFHSFKNFNELLEGDFRFSHFRPKGHYGSWFDAITLHTAVDEDGLADSVVHEAAHQLIDRRLYSGDGSLQSPWIAEGMATYFGHTYMGSDGKFQPGVIGGKDLSLQRRGKPQAGREARIRLRGVKQGLKAAAARELSPVNRVISIRTPQEFYGGPVQFHYGLSWLVVHFLFHGDDGAHADAFARYLALEAEGRGGHQVLLAELEMEPEELETAVAGHIKRLKAR